MIEHVYRRACLVVPKKDIYIVTCDKMISKAVSPYCENIIITSDIHSSGTSRVAEASKEVDCTHALILQADEPLVVPEVISSLKKFVYSNPDIKFINVVTLLSSDSQLTNPSYVKCAVEGGRVIFCFRQSPFVSSTSEVNKFTRILKGIYVYKKDVLISSSKSRRSLIEKTESIEQLRLLTSNIPINYLEVEYAYPEVNTHEDLEKVQLIIKSDTKQVYISKLIHPQT